MSETPWIVLSTMFLLTVGCASIVVKPNQPEAYTKEERATLHSQMCLISNRCGK
jgi:hypothetical protein